jgi:acetyltransferase-like isoleucine patch superfamily enzyme
MTRLVAANDALLELGDDVRMAMGTVINAGTDLMIGHHTLIAGFCVINSSEHNFNGLRNIAEQGFSHEPVYIGEETWIGAKAFIEKGSRIGRGAAIGAGAVVNGEIPAFAVALGIPARVVRFRNQNEKTL